MTIIYRIRATLTDTHPAARHQIRLPANARLDELHTAIAAAFGWSGDKPHVFELGDAVYGDPSVVEDIEPEKSVQLDDIEAGEVFGYVYDLDEERDVRLYVERIAPDGEAEPEPSEMDRLFERAGRAADKAEERWLAQSNGGASEVMVWDPAVLEADSEIAAKVLEVVSKDPALYPVACELGFPALEGWLAEIPDALACAGQLERALEMCEQHAIAAGSRLPRFAAARLLAYADRDDEARDRARKLLAEDPDGPESMVEAADVFASCGDYDEGEALCRKVLAGDPAAMDEIDRLAAYDTLIQILEICERPDEAAELEERAAAEGLLGAEDEKDHEDDEDRQEEAPQEPAPLPKVGRNEPCPCGSGKKFKKCHGA